MASWFERNIKNPLKHGYFGNQRGSDPDYGTDQESYANFQDTIALLGSEKSGIADDYENAINFAGQSGELERNSARRDFMGQQREANQRTQSQGFSSGPVNRDFMDAQSSMTDNLKQSMLGQRQAENQASKQQRESIFGLKSSMQEAYTSFLSNRLNREAGDYDFDVEDNF